MDMLSEGLVAIADCQAIVGIMKGVVTTTIDDNLPREELAVIVNTFHITTDGLQMKEEIMNQDHMIAATMRGMNITVTGMIDDLMLIADPTLMIEDSLRMSIEMPELLILAEIVTATGLALEIL
eukprot:NODE_675_length_5306_cov_0.405224.p5 type:complete len:124 gc:universal NODE_675_length_5306_cov_0.405224:3558-3929(+)